MPKVKFGEFVNKFQSIAGFLLSAVVSSATYAVELDDIEVSSDICSVYHSPATDGYKWSIHRFNLEASESSTVFGVNNNRTIQSVACRPDSAVVLFSMKETQGGDYEIYEYDPSRSEPLKQLTHNDTDDVDVTVSSNGQTMVYQQRLDDGRQALSITYFDEYYQYPAKTLASASPFVQPTLSANGRWLVFVQLRSSYFALMRYDILQNKYTEVRAVPRRKRLYHPSISNDGNIVGWSENRKQNRYLVKDLSTGVITQVLNNEEGIEHGRLSSDGKMLVYSVNSDSDSKVLTTDLNSLETTQIGETGSAASRYLSAVWQDGVNTGSDNASASEATFNLIGSTLKPKDKMFPDSTRITLTFDQEVDSESIAGGVFIKHTATGEIIAAGDSQLEWSHPSEYVEVNPTIPDEPVTVVVVNEDGSSTTTSTTSGGIGRGCGRWSSEDECIEIIDKTVIELSLAISDLEKGSYTLHIASDLVTDGSAMRLGSGVEIPFSILKPQSFYADLVKKSNTTATNRVDLFFRVYNDNAATKLYYKTELSNGQKGGYNFDIGSAVTTGGGGPSGWGYQSCTLSVVTLKTGSSYIENEINYQALSVIMVNDTNADFDGTLNIELCSEGGDCQAFDIEMNVSADPDFDPNSSVPRCQALVN